MQTFNDNNQWSGVWSFYVTEGTPLTLAELAALKEGKGIDREYTAYHNKNVITLLARQRVNEVLAGELDDPSDLTLTREVLGTGTTAPTENDTDLETPDATTEQLISSLSVQDNQLNITSFWAEGTATGNWREYGVKMSDGTLFSHVSIEIDVLVSQAITVSGEITQAN